MTQVRAILHRAMIAAEKQGGRAFSHWTETGVGMPDRYGFGYRDAQGNEWEYLGTVGQKATRTLVRAAGPMTEAERLRARHDEIIKGMDSTTPEQRAEAAECLRLASELDAIPARVAAE